jgi:integrase
LEHYQYEQLRDALPSYLKPVLIMAYLTGCRKSEILSLKWSQVDFLNKQIDLRPKDTKNNEPRAIPIYGELCEALVLLWQNRSEKDPDHDAVFTHRGKRIRYLYDAWKTATQKIGMKGLLLHDCRRTAVRNLVRSTVTDKVARTISGHKTRSVFDRYNIVDANDLQDAGSKMEKYLAEQMATKQLQSEVFDREVANDSGSAKSVTH